MASPNATSLLQLRGHRKLPSGLHGFIGITLHGLGHALGALLAEFVGKLVGQTTQGVDHLFAELKYPTRLVVFASSPRTKVQKIS